MKPLDIEQSRLVCGGSFMLARGQITFVIFWVLNPIVILLFQNCAWTPAQRPEAERKVSSTAATVSERAPACVTSGRASLLCAE